MNAEREANITAPTPILGLDVDPARIARIQRRQEATGKAALIVAIAGTVLLAGFVFLFAAVDLKRSLTKTPGGVTCAIAMLLCGLLSVPTAYVLGAFAGKVRHGNTAKTVALSALGAFLVLIITVALVIGKK